MRGVRAERLDHLGIVAGICREIGLAGYLDGLAGPSQQQVRVGTATVAMILNGLGFSNRRLYPVSQFFASKPVEHLLGAGITAEMLHDDCLGRTLDWLHDHDPTALFAGIARQARQRFGMAVRQVHVDTTAFAVTGEDDTELEAHPLAVTDGSSRDHRADLKPWMVALATTRAGDVPLFCQARDGHASDTLSLVAAVEALAAQWRAEVDHDEEAPLFVADSGLSSAENVARLCAAGVRWISRVPETSKQARAALEVADDAWQHDGTRFWAPVPRAPDGERWVVVRVVVRTTPGEERVRSTRQRQVETTRTQWEQALWHVGHQRFARAPDAQAALAQHLKQRPQWLTVQAQLIPHPQQRRPGRPRQGTPPDRTEWQIQATVTVADEAVTRAVQRKASFLVATNVLAADQLADQELIRTDEEQHSVERGFSFLKDPLVLASSAFVKKPTRMVALSVVMVRCLLVDRLAEHRVREPLAATGQTVPNQLKRPTDHPTLRWLFPCVEGVSLVVFQPPHGPPQRDLAGREPWHGQVAALVGPSCAQRDNVDG